MCALRERALDWADPEGVHDMRVASRRLREALNDFSPYLRNRPVKEATKSIRKLADALGEVRDQDVAIMALQKLDAGVPPEVATTLDSVIRLREANRTKTRRELRKALSRVALKRLANGFTSTIEAAVRSKRSSSGSSEGELRYVDIARVILAERLKDVEELSDAFYEPLRIKPLHKLRIATKRLRYALELFEQCLGDETLGFAKKIARLQESLGELHDCDAWIKAFGNQLNGSRSQPADNHVAGSLWLLQHFLKLHSRHLRSALSQWQEWETGASSQRLRELLAEPEAATPVQ
jgi:CHAD domain-containing protein